MAVTIDGREVSKYSDRELVSWIDEVSRSNGYKGARAKTAATYVAILRAFDSTGIPMTVRQVFYALVANGVMPKSESAYCQVGYHLLRMRRRGILPYHFIADNTRWMRKPQTYDSVYAFLETGQKTYRRGLWQDQGVYVEVWCEKDALAGVISKVTEWWDVPLMITRGFPSETFIYEAAEAIKAQAKPAYVYYFGDHDPSGVAITQSVKDKLMRFGADFLFERMAVQPWQIDAWNLPTRPTKRTDKRAKNWRGGSVELDAIPADKLRELVRDVIEQHIDQRALKETKRVEALERETLEQVLSNFRLD